MADATPATNATNHTRYFNLPLFVSTDRPSWLVDWNGAMGEIDTILNDIATTSEGASSAVATIKTQIDTLSATVTSLNGIVNTAVADVASMQTTVDTVETRLDSVEADLITQNNLIKTLSDTVVAMQSTVATLNNHVDTLNDSVTAMGVNVSAIQTALNGVTSDIATINSTLTSLDTRVTALENASPSSNGFPAIGDLEDASKYTVQRVGGARNADETNLTPFYTASNDCYAIAMAWVVNGTNAPVTDAYEEVTVGNGYQGVGVNLVAYGNLNQTADVDSGVRGHQVTSSPIKLKAGDTISARGHLSSDTSVTNFHYALIYTPV